MSRLMNQSVNERYEAVGMDLDQAMRVAETIGHGSVIWAGGHCYPGDGIVVRPVGCLCASCAANKPGTEP